MRQTRQKTLIDEALFKRKRHIKAEELLSELNRDGRIISRATVYRRLEELLNAGKLKSVKCGKSIIYDSCLEKHGHFVCLSCGTLIDLPLDITKLYADYAELDLDIEDAEIIFKGKCRKCREKEKNYGIKGI